METLVRFAVAGAVVLGLGLCQAAGSRMQEAERQRQLQAAAAAAAQAAEEEARRGQQHQAAEAAAAQAAKHEVAPESAAAAAELRCRLAAGEYLGACPICFDEHGDWVLGCGHAFCIACLSRSLACDNGEGRAPRCPEPSCLRDLEEEEWLGLVSQQLTDAFRARATAVEAAAAVPGLVRCMHCREGVALAPGQLPHQTPCPYPGCGRMLDSRPEAGLADYVAQHNVKRCPQCTALVSKRDGCNRMVCRCGGVFCYRCGEALPKNRGYAHFRGGPCGLRLFD